MNFWLLRQSYKHGDIEREKALVDTISYFNTDQTLELPKLIFFLNKK